MTQFIQDFFAWYNLIFYVSIIIGLTFIVAAAMGMGADADVDIDIDMDGDVDINTGGVGRALSVLGIGRCPASIVMFTAFLVFGGSGVILNVFFAPYLAILSVGGAFFAMIFLTRIIAIGVSKIMPNTETYEIKPDHFIGRKGKVILKTTDTFGKVHIRDENGSLHKLHAVSYPNITYDIGTEVLIIDHKENTYYVADPLEIK